MSLNLETDSLYKNLSIKNKLIMSFFWILFFVLISFAYLFWSNIDDNFDASYKTDVAGRTRMSSQKIGALTFLMTNSDEHIRNVTRTELIKTINLFESIVNTLKNGGLISGTDYLLKPTTEKEILIHLNELESVFSEYKNNVQILIDSPLYINARLTDIVQDSNAVYLSNKIHNPVVIASYNKAIEDFLKGDILKMANILVELYAENDAKIHLNEARIRNIIFSILLLILVIVIITNFILMRKYVAIPINQIADVATQIADGNLSAEIVYNIKDEFGKVVSAINTLVGNLRESAQFILQIGQGNFDAKYNAKINENVNEQDNLAVALLNMRNQLKKISDEDKSRKWATEGFAKFGDILRINNNDFKELSNNIISNLVKYLSANQGGLFIINDNDKDDVFLELIACYAFDKKKYLTKKIIKGEGLVGQTWQEGEYIYLTDVPNEYVNITSGLGGANPRSILIMPLKINEEIFGVIELASFNEITQYEIEFVKKLSESIASTISTAKINIRTKELLEISQQQTEEMKAQEEEMRQNMEELAATQDEMTRKSNELEVTLNAINATIGTIEYSLDGKILSINKFFMDITQMNEKDIVGHLHTDFINKVTINDSQYYEQWNNIRNGITYRCETNYAFPNGKKIWLLETYNPIKNAIGNIEKVLTGVIDITEAKNLLFDIQKQNEEMKAQEEELRQNMEEIASINEAIEKEKQEFKKHKELELQEQIRITSSYESEITSMMKLWFEHLEGIEKILVDKGETICKNNKK